MGVAMEHSEKGGGRPRRVLVVEDLPFSQEIARLVLEAGGHRVDVAENGVEAVERVRRHRYDLVLMDLDLPVMDGYAASSAIRRLSPSKRAVPVVALTARGGAAETERCRRAGMNDHIAKPFAPADLLRHVEHWTQGREDPHSHVTPVWNEITYRDLARRLGPGRMTGALGLFEAQLSGALDAIQAAPGDRGLLERKAHGLASTAGMLGFAELCEVCRRIMAAGAEAKWNPLSRDLSRAAHRALAHLKQGPCQAAEAEGVADGA